MKKALLFTITVLFAIGSYFLWNSLENNTSISDLRTEHEAFLANHAYTQDLQLSKEERKAKGIPPNKYFEEEYLLEMNPRTGRSEPEKLYALQERLNNEVLEKGIPGYDDMWEERGPFNVPGRTRAIMFDPNDDGNQRVFAGGVSGGLWTSENIETTSSLWERVEIPENLAISSITYDVNNSQNMFIGTGESYVSGSVNGNGIWRSTNGGNTWEHVFGGSTGETYYNGNATLTVNTPVAIAGIYAAMQSNGDVEVPDSITEDLVLADDGSANPTEACNDLTTANAAEMNGKIAVIERGECFFVDKIMHAQDAGAVAVIMVNNVAGTPISMAIDTSTTITIPAFMITREDGLLLMEAMETEIVNATFEFDEDNDPAGVLVPGTFHINDIRVRNNEGVSEIYAAVSDSGSETGAVMGAGTYGLYKSVDNGDSWVKITLPDTGDGNEYMPNDIEIAADNKIWIGTTKNRSYGNSGGVVLSSSDGEAFEVKYTVPGDGERVELGVSATDPNKLYVLAEHAHTSLNVLIFKTLDAFATTPANMSKPNDADSGIPANDFTRGQAFYDLMIAVDPSDDDIVYVGGVDSFRSTDGASSWEQMSKWAAYVPVSRPYVHADQHELVFHPTDSNKAIMATDGGVFFASSLSGAVSGSSGSISERKWYYNTTQFYKGAIGQDETSDDFLAGAQDNGSFFRGNAVDGLNTFTEINGGDGCYCFIDKDGEYMVVSTPGNNFYKKTSSGSSAGTLISENSGSFVNIAELDDNLDILYTNASTSTSTATNYRIARISNILGTPSRTNLTNEMFDRWPTALKVSPYVTASSTLFIGTNSGDLYKVENADASPTWTEITGDDFFGSVSAINFGANADEIMVTFHNYGVDSIWFTEDGGITWESKEGDFPDIPVKDILMNPLLNNEVIIATDLGVWMTDEFDTPSPTWERAANGMQNVKVTSFDLRTSDNTVLASTYGRGIFTGQFSLWPASVEENELSQALSVYPTVSNGNITIRANKDFTDTNVRVYDLQGKQVYTTSIDLNTTETSLNLNLNTGIYIMKFTSNNISTSERIIIE